MRRGLISSSVLALVVAATICFGLAMAGAFHQGPAPSAAAPPVEESAFMSEAPAASAAATCAEKHCPQNTHCCYGCTANPICVKNGVPCPECAPR